MILNIFKEAFFNAWDMLIDFPLLYWGKKQEREPLKFSESEFVTQLCFPVVGLVCALLALLAGVILNKFLSPIPAAAVFAGLLTYFCIYKDEGRGLAGLMALVVSRKRKIPIEEVLFNLPDNIGDVNAPAATLTMVLVVLFKLFVFYFMAYYGYVYWLVAVCVLEFAIEGDLASIPTISVNSPLLHVKKSKQRFIWFVAGFLVLFILFEAPVATLILFGAAFGLTYAFKLYCKEKLGGIDSRMIGFAAYVFELLALLLGFVLLTKGHVLIS
jgi:cobalamin synthase